MIVKQCPGVNTTHVCTGQTWSDGGLEADLAL